MGFLDKLWDDTLAGPTPDAGLGKLRKYNSFSAPRSPTAVAAAAPPPPAAAPPSPDDHLIPISRSITVVGRDARRNLTVSVGSPSAPSSPSGSITPTSPFSPTSPGGNFRKFTRRKTVSGAPQNSESESKDDYDWIMMINSMDR